MLLKVLLVLCLLISFHWHCGVHGRGRVSSRSRVSHSYRTHKGSSSGSNVGWFSWFRGSSKSNTAATGTGATTKSDKKPLPPSIAHRNTYAQSPSHIGFAAYGNNYQANFHNHHFQPVSHPYQSHFQPQTTSECELCLPKIRFINNNKSCIDLFPLSSHRLLSIMICFHNFCCSYICIPFSA